MYGDVRRRDEQEVLRVVDGSMWEGSPGVFWYNVLLNIIISIYSRTGDRY